MTEIEILKNEIQKLEIIKKNTRLIKCYQDQIDEQITILRSMLHEYERSRHYDTIN